MSKLKPPTSRTALPIPSSKSDLVDGSSSTPSSSQTNDTPDNKNKLETLSNTVNDTATTTGTSINNNVTTTTSARFIPNSPSGKSFTPVIGDKVKVISTGQTGTLRFAGITSFKGGRWAGIELDLPGTGKNDGKVSDIRCLVYIKIRLRKICSRFFFVYSPIMY